MLYLGHNYLTGTIPLELANLQMMQGLSLDYNQLSGTIPGGLGVLSSLQFFTFGTQLTSWNHSQQIQASDGPDIVGPFIQRPDWDDPNGVEPNGPCFVELAVEQPDS